MYLSPLKEKILSMSDDQIIRLLKLDKKEPCLRIRTSKEEKWYEKNICGLSPDGLKLLDELEKEAANPRNNVEKKQLRYLRQLKAMRLEVPQFFKEEVEPKKLYLSLRDFCVVNDIPEEIVSMVVPALVTFIKTGHMRPILFVGEKGSGKTTAVKKLITEALKIPMHEVNIPQLSGSHGLTGDNASYQSSDAGCLAVGRLRKNSLIVGYIFDEIDKVSGDTNRFNPADELLSITDDSNSGIYDKYLEDIVVGLEYCPMFFTANNLEKVNPFLVDRCCVVHFPNPDAMRIKSIMKKYVNGKMKNDIYKRMVKFDYGLMERFVEHLIKIKITSIREHQKVIENVLRQALDEAFTQSGDDIVTVTENMFGKAVDTVMGSEMKRKVGF